MYELIMNEKEQRHLRAELIFAKKLELIEDDTLNGVEDRRQKENHKREEMLQKGEIVYGAEHFFLPAYVRYEQTRFRLDFVSESEKVKKNYTYREISEEVIDAIVRNEAVYFAAVGGAGALLSKSILSSEVIAYDDLGTEAIRKLEVKDFPAIVVIDKDGNNLYETAVKEYNTLS